MLADVAAGTIERAALEALASAVLDDEVTQLALAVREGGPHSIRRAIELAALVLARAARFAVEGAGQ